MLCPAGLRDACPAALPGDHLEHMLGAGLPSKRRSLLESARVAITSRSHSELGSTSSWLPVPSSSLPAVGPALQGATARSAAQARRGALCSPAKKHSEACEQPAATTLRLRPWSTCAPPPVPPLTGAPPETPRAPRKEKHSLLATPPCKCCCAGCAWHCGRWASSWAAASPFTSRRLRQPREPPGMAGGGGAAPCRRRPCRYCPAATRACTCCRGASP